MLVDHFIAISAELTGFSAEELRATGMAGVYRAVVLERAGAERLGRLEAAVTGAGDGPLGLDEEPERELARAVAHLWYLGTWPGLRVPEDSKAQRLAGEPFVVSSRAYTEGLAWRTFHGNAPGTAAQGHGSWSTAPPAGATRDADAAAPAERR
ncbi:hypothetical protein F7Q99_34600 [Streptomyces kaniharaensis]|uniref:Uncharacterized protein n=1 Tax=Streptomyces kaniharaensis TaxID=212423 RepID=A0A6N7L345_9ACTN|nr:hypothetical protein [Streptomyces kaniharaensis]MQS17177.1 hypothetical protein [Streptomyces kaniharaensis]